MIAYTVASVGAQAVKILAGCAAVCLPVFAVRLLASDWLWARLERRYRREMAEDGVSPERIEAGWRQITKDRDRA